MKKLLQCNTKKKILRLDIVNLKKKTPKETVMKLKISTLCI